MKVWFAPPAPRPFVDAGGRPEAAEGLADIRRGVRQGTVGDIARWHKKGVGNPLNLIPTMFPLPLLALVQPRTRNSMVQ